MNLAQSESKHFCMLLITFFLFSNREDRPFSFITRDKWIFIRDVTRSRATGSDVSREIRLVSRERDDILPKHFAMFTLEMHH